MNRKNTAATDRLIEAGHGSYVCMGMVPCGHDNDPTNDITGERLPVEPLLASREGALNSLRTGQ